MSNQEEASTSKNAERARRTTIASNIIEISDSEDDAPGPSSSRAADIRPKNSPGSQATTSKSPKKEKYSFTTPTRPQATAGSSKIQIVDLTLDDSPEDFRGFASQAILNDRHDSDDYIEIIIKKSAPRRRARPSVIEKTAEEIAMRDRRIGDLKPHISLSAKKPDISSLPPLPPSPCPSPSTAQLPPSPLPAPPAPAQEEEDPDATITSITLDNPNETGSPANLHEVERSPSVEYEPYDPQPNDLEEGASFVSDATIVSSYGDALLPSLPVERNQIMEDAGAGNSIPDLAAVSGSGSKEKRQEDMEIDELASQSTSDAPAQPAKAKGYDSSDDSDAGPDHMHVDEPELLFTDAEGRSHSPLGALSTPPPHYNQITAAESNRKKQRKRMRQDAYKPHPIGYQHRGAIEWTGPERSNELDRSVLDRWLHMKYPDPNRNHREFFENFINSQIAIEEPFAPPVQILDRSFHPAGKKKKKKQKPDPALSYPPIEYFYTSRIAYRAGVPDPVKFVACDCTDGCGPGCKCFQRQQDLIKNLGTDAQVPVPSSFAYDEHGSLVLPHPYPVWECNSHCGCPQDCRNRNVGNGRRVKLNIVKTKYKGWGIEAGQDIPKGTFLCLYGGEMITAFAAKEREIQNDLEDPPRSYLFDVDSQWLRHHDGGATLDKDGFVAIGTTWGKNGRPPSPKKLRNQLMTEEQEQAEEDGVKALYVIDARHYGNLARYFNHACDPNAVLRSVFVDDQDVWKPLLCIFARRAIPKGDEITISYKGLREEDTNMERCAVSETSPPPKQKGKSRKKKGWRTEKQVGKARSGDMQGAVDTECRCDSECCDGSIFTWKDEEDE